MPNKSLHDSCSVSTGLSIALAVILFIVILVVFLIIIAYGCTESNTSHVSNDHFFSDYNNTKTQKHNK